MNILTMKFGIFTILVALLIVGKGVAKDGDNSPEAAVEVAEPAKNIVKEFIEAKEEKIGEDGCDPEGEDEDKTGCQIVKNEENEEAKEMKAQSHRRHYLTNFRVAHRGDVKRINRMSEPLGRTLEDESDLVPENSAKSKGKIAPTSPKKSPESRSLQSPESSTNSTKDKKSGKKAGLLSRIKNVGSSGSGPKLAITKKSHVNATKNAPKIIKPPPSPPPPPPPQPSKAKEVGLGLDKKPASKPKKTKGPVNEEVDMRKVDEREIVKYTEPIRLPEDADCSEVTRDSHWDDQKPIRPCHYTTHYQPRQQYREKWGHDKASVLIRAKFKHLALFNIKHDLDFQEAGDPCSVKLQTEFMHMGGEVGQPPQPIPLDAMSFNIVWYKRLCSFFSFLECIPANEVRQKVKPGDESKKTNATNEDQIYYPDSGRDTTGLIRLKIGGRGPGKARHKAGPGGERLDHRLFQGLSDIQEDDEYPLDGICVCHANDPKYPDRENLTDYGMDFVEDEARPRWCVAAPGNLCGRVYFRRALWPGQQHYEFSDHIGCPRRYKGEEYECIRWAKDPNVKTNRTKYPHSWTSTCEKKLVDPELEKESQIAEEKQRARTIRNKMKKNKRRKSHASSFRIDIYSIILLIVVAIYLL